MRFASLRVAFFSSVLLLAASVVSIHGAEPGDKLPWDDAVRLPTAIAQLLQDRNYDGAIAALDAALKKATAADELQAELQYAKGRALHMAGKYDDAATAFEQLEKAQAKSSWARRGRFARGVTLARKGDFASAELIYRAEAEYLLSHERKQELADIYLDFAKKYATPRDEKSPPDQPEPDYSKALEFFGRALALGPKPELRPEIELQMAECYRLSGNYEEAATRYAKFIKDHADNPRQTEARYRLGESQLHLGHTVEARQTWQDVVALWPGDKRPPGGEVQLDFLAKAAFGIATTYGMPNPGDDDALELGSAAVEAFLQRFSEHKLAGQAHLSLIQARFARGRYAEAVTAAERYLSDEKRAAAEEAADVRRLLGFALRQQKKFTEALAAWRDFLVKHPSHAAWSEVQQRIIETEYLIGLEAFEKKDYAEARKQWTEFLLRYPLDSRSPLIMLQFGRAEYLAEKWDAAIVAWRQLVSKYPGHEVSSQAQLLIGLTLEEKLGKPTAAMQEYKKLNWGSQASVAQARIARLTAKQLEIATERIYRTDETPKVRLQSRNIDKVTVRVYTVDLETYFRKMHLARGVEALDLALIDPDHSFEFTVPDYAEFKPCASHIDIPLPGPDKANADAPGVVAVTVGSKTMEAVTLVIRSDLDIIIKSSRDEVFAYAQNMRTGKPWKGAKLLVSNGSEVFAEGTSGDDGVFRGTYKPLRDAADVRVFAVSGGHTASNVVGLDGVGLGRGLEERGYLYTDRGAYRPGQVVHARGIIRGVADDRFVVVPKKKYRLETYDPRNRLVYTAEVVTGDFGSFHAFFPLPEGAAPGDYRLQACDIDGRCFQGSFRVENYQLDPVQFTIDSERKVFYRGEDLEGTITAKFYYGTPLAGREIRYTLSDGRTQTAVSDDKGQVRFKFPTREYRESQALQLIAELPERNLRTAANFMLAVQAFSIDVAVSRSVVTAGESFEATITTRTADGKPTGEKLKLHVIEQTQVDGKAGENEIEVRDVETDAKTGIGRVTLKIEKGARYTLRAEGRDRFNNPVTGRVETFVSDDSDLVRLRILADRHTYKLGEEAKVRLVWREAEATALVTYQGAKILGHKLVSLKNGNNELVVPMEAYLAPNFTLEVNVMIDVRDPVEKKLAAGEADKVAKATPTIRRRFHSAASPFTVERDLTVKITTARRAGATGPIQPGETIDVTIQTTDPLGKPVAAEVGLAMIDKANFDRFGSAAAAIGEFFRGATREAAIRTTASIDFAYKPTTHTINPRLLTEQERLEMQSQEEVLRQSLALANQSGPNDAAGYYMRGRYLQQAGQAEGLMADTRNVELYFEMQNEDGARYLKRFEQLSEESQQRGVAPTAQPLYSQIDSPQAGFQYGGGAINAPAGRPGLSGGGAMAANGPPSYRAREELAKKRDGVISEKAEYDRQRIMAGEDIGGVLGELAAQDFKAPATSKLNLDAVQNFAFAIDGENGRTSGGDVAAMRGYFNEHAGRVIVVTDGVQSNIDYLELADEAKSQALVERLKRSGAVVLAAVEMQETAYWNPAIVTDAAGKAVVAITLPDRSTAWKLLAKGISVDTLAGETEDELTAKKELFGELALPSVVTDGDTVEASVTVHDDRARAADKPAAAIEVTLKTTIGSKSTEEKKTIPAGVAGLHELTFPLVVKLPETPAAAADDKANEKADEAARPDAVEFTLTISSGDRSSVVERTLPVRPFGYPVFAGNGGSATSDTTVWIEQPEGMELERPRLEIVVGAGIDRSLLEVVLGGRIWCDYHASYASPLETTTSDLLASLSLQKLLNTTRDQGTAEAAELDARVRSAIGSLTSAQADDGGWTWTGSAGTSDTFASARVVWALSAAKGAGYAVPQDTYEKALAYLTGRQSAVADDDLEGKAVVLQALAEGGRGDFALANRLYRSRASLSPAATSYLALALAKMDHVPMAADLLAVFENRDLDAPAGVAGAAKLISPNAGPAEIRALYGLALTRAGVDSQKLKETVDWLLAHRSGSRWSPERATGPATAVLAEWFAKHRPGGERYQLTVVVNNYEAAKIEIDPNGAARTIAIDRRHLVKGKQRIQFLMTGRGHLAYQCLLGGFVSADKLKNTSRNWYAERTIEPALREFDGRELPRGFGVVTGNYSPFRNPLTQLPIGRRGHIDLRVYRNYPNGYLTDDKLEYLVVREPLPAGTSAVEQTIRGGFERYEILPGEIVFYVGNRRHIDAIHYDVVGAVGGEYRAAPTMVVGAYRPEQMAVAKTITLAVLPKGRASADAYRWSPDELFELGKRTFEKRDWPAVRTHLTELLAGWQLDATPYQEVLRMLLDTHLVLGPPGDVVKYFELVKEKSPDLEIPFEKILKVGAAYHELGEYERSYLVFRATVESSFVHDSAVAGFLESQGEFLRSVDVMRRLLAEYPPEPYAASAEYALAQGVYAYAPNAATDPKLREKKLTKLALVAAAERMLDDFLTSYPDDPAADQAAFADANALLDMEQYDRAIARCEASAKRYANSDFLDSYFYIIGYSHFAASRPDAALEMCRKVAEMKRTDKATGREIESRNRERAIFILGQVYHSLGKAAEAIREYTRVAEQIPDAKKAIEYFARAAIQLPEVTTIRPGEPAKVSLDFRNVPRCDVKTYRIDLMKFSLLRQNLGGITQINLSGIRPLYETTIELGDGKDYRDRKHELTLPIKDEGAYLVVCRGDNLHTSGFVLVSPLKVEVQEDTANGQVRATVKDVIADKYASGIHVKVIGARDGDFKSGETDLRGVFSAEPISGRSTVIAQAGTDRYAFFRGELDLLPPPPPEPTTGAPAQQGRPQAEAKPAEQRKQSNKDYLLEELQGGNRMLQQLQIDNLRNNYYNNDNKGVKAKAAF